MKKLKQLMNNEKGFTLVEILVVIAIIAILFVTLLPQIDNAVNRSRETGVKTDFHTMQTAMETYQRETAGKGLKASTLNKFLDPGMAIKVKTPATNGLLSTKLDPWGKPYDVYFYDAHSTIIMKSGGPNESQEALSAIATSGDYAIATYYHNGQVSTCTIGFDTNNVVSDVLLATGPTKVCALNHPKAATGLTEGAAATAL